jgi:D-inositol-3-phosphate glycosyltransferase
MTKYCLPWGVRPVPGRNLDEDCPDIAHAHFWMSGIATELVARQLDLPTVLTFHGLGAHGLRRRMESKLARAVTWVSASCTGEASELIRMGRPRSCTSVIPCPGVHSEWAAGSPKRRASRRWCGKDIAGQRFRRTSSSFATDSRWSPTGYACTRTPPSPKSGVAAVRRCGRACTPTYEPSGVVALEAMACGVPVVACAVGPLPDIVVHEVTGFLVDRQDPRDLAASVNHLLRDSFLRRRLGAAGRDGAAARYSWDRVAADTARRLYEPSMSAWACERTAAS